MSDWQWLGAGISEEKLNRKVARLPGVKGEVAAEGKKRAAVAKGVLAKHRHFNHAKIETEQGHADFYVFLDDSRGQWAANLIEFGRNGFIRQAPARFGKVALQYVRPSKPVGALRAAMKG